MLSERNGDGFGAVGSPKVSADQIYVLVYGVCGYGKCTGDFGAGESVCDFREDFTLTVGEGGRKVFYRVPDFWGKTFSPA